MEKLPTHVAIIMDGNGRWAEAQGKPRAFGHQAGADMVRSTTERCCERGIPYLTLYAFSTENWARLQSEVDALMELLGHYLEAELPTMQKNDIRFRSLGDPARLPTQLREKIAKTEAATAGNKAMNLNVAINYGGRDEIVRACRRAIISMGNGGCDPSTLDETLLSDCLDTAGMPDPDLVIRTAGEMRLSNFLIWQAAYAEFVFVKKTWPEFTKDEFDAALAEYAFRVRKFGGTSTMDNYP